ncbi:hypothetical protein [Phocaeicola sartorii]|uniref:hypothetical protein n=1 Tax=Phocaeicola sartorii TaxID=671267 RepID=UPI0035147C8F
MEQYMKQYQFAEVDEFVKIARQAWEYVVLKKTISLSELRKCYIALAQSNPDEVVTELRRNILNLSLESRKELEKEYSEILKKLHNLEFRYNPEKKFVQYTACSAFCCSTEKNREIIDDCEEKEICYTTINSDEPQEETLNVSALADLLHSKFADLRDGFLRLGFSLGNRSEFKEVQFQEDISQNDNQGNNKEYLKERYSKIYDRNQLEEIHQRLVVGNFLTNDLEAWLYYWGVQDELPDERNIIWLDTGASLAYFIEQMYLNRNKRTFPASITERIFMLKDKESMRPCKNLKQSLYQVHNRKRESENKRGSIYNNLKKIIEEVTKATHE